MVSDDEQPVRRAVRQIGSNRVNFGMAGRSDADE
jgi:hypothetical protein